MSDRSSSDIQNRNVVKNPLLLSAVTGLSFEDLTHNAVLLPVTPSQGVIPTQDDKVQNPTNTNPVTHNIPSGDALIDTKPTLNLYQNPSLSVQTSQYDKTKTQTSGTLSNASKKSNDDFDVNEYFARLQGTRYVSAPLNSHLKEDNNANLDESEGNLEEINLNETDKANEETQQSITADIAQNFSQLPTMLPQVASAVFSSFSNMLNMKSREQTPDIVENRQRQEMENKQESISVSGAPELSAPPRDVAQPPKEPPMMSGAGSYRITTKKKAYAQIPGLSSKDPPSSYNPSSMSNFNPPSIPPTNMPSFFVPNTENTKTEADGIFNPLEIKNTQSVPNFPLADNTQSNVSQSDKGNPVSLFNPASEVTNVNPNIYPQSISVQFSGTSSVSVPPPNSAPIAGIPRSSIADICPSRNSTAVERPQTSTILVEAPTGIPCSNLIVDDLQQSSVHNEFSPAASNVAVGLTLADSSAQVGLPPTDSSIQVGVPASSISVGFPPAKSIQADLFASIVPEMENLQPQEPNLPANILPPPPMFTNLPRKVFVDYQNQVTVGKSVLPPSVARRLASNHPVIRQNVPTLQPYHDNMFVPAPVDSTSNIEQIAASTISTPPIVSNSPKDMLTPSIRTTKSAVNVEPPKPVIFTPTVQLPLNSSVNVQPELIQASINSPPTSMLPSSQLPQTKSAALSTDIPLPPTFFNPSTLKEEKPDLNVMAHQIQPFTQETPNTTHLFDTSTQEPPKSIPLPPKVTGSQSYRMAKKKPQYYSGPIEGVGSMSNTVKPFMPAAGSSSYHGAMFSPESTNSPALGTEPNINPAPFDISRPVENLPADTFALTQAPSQPQLSTEYNTVFDFSRPTTENYPPPKEESKGFGIIGSLKSKLSSIDINKLQDKVTTFFDPAYNDTKVETQSKDNSYRQLQNPYEDTNQSSNYDIFVPAAQQASDEYTSIHGFGYPTTEYSNYNQNLPTQYYEVQNANNFNTQSYYTNTQVDQNMYYQQTQHSEVPTFVNLNQTSAPSIAKDEGTSNIAVADITSNFDLKVTDKTTIDRSVEPKSSNQQGEFQPLQATQEILTPASSFFDQPTDIVHSFSNLQITQDSISVEHYISENKDHDNFTATLLYDSPKKNAKTDEVNNHNAGTAAIPAEEIVFDKRKNSADVSGVSLFDLSNLIADRSKEEQQSYESNVVSEGNLTKYGSVEKVSDLNICETCREVNKPEDQEDVVDDLTTQLIENITSPIQLLNPVEVPLTEHNTPVDVVDEGQQRAEISHISEETIETIHVQAGHELLEEIRATVGEVNNYGWANSETTCPTNIKDTYDFQVNPETIGFLGSNSIFSNMPANASDEIKAEFKYTADDNVIPQTPSAPELKENIQFDEASALDVHSIEQDATNDFPVFEEEEFVIEPSETDDDKIEFITGHRKSIENVDEFESFTNRVDKYKKMEETIEKLDTRNSQVLGATSPAITIASYFDTGNYAVETHYRNSLSSPSNMNFGVGSPNMPMSIPPGFEEEFKRRLSGLSSHESFTPFLQKRVVNPNTAHITSDPMVNYDFISQVEDTVSVPETQTQTHQISTTTYSNVQQILSQSFPSFTPQSTDLVNVPEIHTQSQHTITHSTNQNVNTYLKDQGTSVFFQKNDPRVPETQTMADITTTAQLFKIPVSTKEAAFDIKDKSQDLDKKEPIVTAYKDENSPEQETIPAFIDVFAQNVSNDIIIPQGEIRPVTQTAQQSKAPENTLPDPKNFFSTSPTPNNESDNGFNRLASYFSTPAKTEPSKPFFELSQSQNHYRHASEPIANINNNQNIFLNTNQSVNNMPRINLQNIPHEQYIANLNLMKDLTAPDNIVNPDPIVRTINYMTIQYDNDNSNDSSTKESKLNDIPPDSYENENIANNIETNVNIASEKLDETINSIDNDLKQTDDKKNNGAIKVLENCKYCCEFVDKIDVNDSKSKELKVKKSMNTETENTKEVTKSSEAVPTTTVNSVTVNLTGFTYDETDDGVTATTKNTPIGEYTPVKHHWFYRVDFEGKSLWKGFSAVDSKALEDALEDPNLSESTTVPTDGGRYDVNVLGRLRIPVYWTEKPTNVRRCSWFYKGTTDARYVPYSEEVATKLEEEYRTGVTSGTWHRRLQLPNQEAVVMHSPTYMVHLAHALNTDSYTAPTLMFTVFNKRVYRNPPKIKVIRNEHERIDHLVMLVHGAGEYKKQKEKNTAMRDVGVRRGCSEYEIEDASPSSVDHLLLLCHGVGSACDLRFRSVEEVVDDFRATTQQLLQSHYKNSYDLGIVGRVEVLPISWHTTLHSGERGVDRRLAQITLHSIPRLRNFTNDTVLDVLFYTSPVFCQTILDTVCNELNRIYRLFRTRNPDFKGSVSLGGHSLGSVILYDLLCHQQSSCVAANHKCFVGGGHSLNLNYPQLDFSPDAMYAMGSPIAIFECIRGVESLGLDFSLPTCKHFFNIFHPYDPIAYRIEPLINPNLKNVKPFLIPHHKGRKRMHLELKDTMARVGADIKHKIVESIRATWASVWRTAPPPTQQLEKVVEEEIENERLVADKEDKDAPAQFYDIKECDPGFLGVLNSGRRVDHVLQEAPLEIINEYLFAMGSHVCYWESEDTMLMILREIYDAIGVQPDCTVPQQTMTVERTRIKDDCLSKPEFPSTSRDLN